MIKRKIMTAVFATVAVFMGSISVYADNVHFDENGQKIYDDAGLLSSAEEKDLTEELVELALDIELDIIVVTTKDTGGKTTALYADDFYDDNGFGYDKARGDGVLLLIDMQHREVFISTTVGKSRNYISDSEAVRIAEAIAPYIGSGDYAEGIEEFIDRIDALGDNLFTWFKLTKHPLVTIVVSLAIAGIAVLIMNTSSKTKVTVDSKTYMKGNAVNMNTRVDRFTHTTTTKRKIEKESSGGSSRGSSGGSTRTSSSGGRHGGGGAKF